MKGLRAVAKDLHSIIVITTISTSSEQFEPSSRSETAIFPLFLVHSPGEIVVKLSGKLVGRRLLVRVE